MSDATDTEQTTDDGLHPGDRDGGDDRTTAFIGALRALEDRNDVEPLVRLHTGDAEVGNVVSPRTFSGPDGAREFWTTYRQTLGEITSTFRTIVVAGDRAALEWTTAGVSPNGHRIEYDGVSVIEFAGDRVSRFRAYFDSAKLGHQIADE